MCVYGTIYGTHKYDKPLCAHREIKRTSLPHFLTQLKNSMVKNEEKEKTSYLVLIVLCFNGHSFENPLLKFEGLFLQQCTI